jgi:hypothetical protein
MPTVALLLLRMMTMTMMMMTTLVATHVALATTAAGHDGCGCFVSGREKSLSLTSSCPHHPTVMCA